jgi:FlaG/FlaF family flagellin (archaellin)
MARRATAAGVPESVCEGRMSEWDMVFSSVDVVVEAEVWVGAR